MTTTVSHPWTGHPVAHREATLQLGVWMFLATVTMLFAAFTSAYIVRSAGTDWRPTQLPSILWLNTGLLIVSSVVLEWGRRAADHGRWVTARTSVAIAMLLGLGFLVGQFAGWRALVDQGVYLPTSPHSAFFFMLTGVHALHLGAGLVVLLVGVAQLAPHRRDASGASGARYLRLATTFWHFFGALWVYLFALLTRF